MTEAESALEHIRNDLLPLACDESREVYGDSAAWARVYARDVASLLAVAEAAQEYVEAQGRKASKDDQGRFVLDFKPQQIALRKLKEKLRALAALSVDRCSAVSPRGEHCKYAAGHDDTGEPHSWTLMRPGS